MSWTNEYHGVRHLKGVPKSHQITLIKYDSFHEVYMLHLHGSKPFDRVKEHVGTEAECIKAAERWAASIK